MKNLSSFSATYEQQLGIKISNFSVANPSSEIIWD